MSKESDFRGLTRRGYNREDARVWREVDQIPEDSAPADRPTSVIRLEDWGVTQEQAGAMLRERMCPACGSGPWGSVLTHASKRHGVDGFTMRELCGLTTTEVLASPDVSAKLSALSRARAEDRDMSELAGRPRKKYRHTTAGVRALTENLGSDAAEKGRQTPEYRERLAESISASWASMSDEEKSARLANLHAARRKDRP